jgi:hypothetical protein
MDGTPEPVRNLECTDYYDQDTTPSHLFSTVPILEDGTYLSGTARPINLYLLYMYIVQIQAKLVPKKEKMKYDQV